MTGRPKRIAQRTPCFHFSSCLAFYSNKHHQYFSPLYELHVGHKQRLPLIYDLQHIWTCITQKKLFGWLFFWKKNTANSSDTLWSQILLFSFEEQQLADRERLQINLVIRCFTYILWCSDEGLVENLQMSSCQWQIYEKKPFSSWSWLMFAVFCSPPQPLHRQGAKTQVGSPNRLHKLNALSSKKQVGVFISLLNSGLA